jgi:hypothetical protein
MAAGGEGDELTQLEVRQQTQKDSTERLQEELSVAFPKTITPVQLCPSLPVRR